MRPFLLALVVVCASLGCAQPERTSDPPAERTFDPPPTVLYLLRHAETADGAGPGLSAAGQARAEALAAALGGRRIQAVYASQFRRTQATARPLADTLGLDVTVRPLDTADPRGSAAAQIRQVAAEHARYRAVVVGHSNTVPAMVEALTGEPMADLPHDAYGDLLVVSITAAPEARTPDDVTVERRRVGAEEGASGG